MAAPVSSPAVSAGDPYCDVAFDEGLPLGEGAEVALEDYARAVLSASAAEVLRAGEGGFEVMGVRVSRPALAPTPQARRDLQDFARSLAMAGPGAGLGWS